MQKRQKHVKWANGHFNQKVVSSSEQKTAPFDLLVIGPLPSSVEATATNLRQGGDSLSSAKSYVLHIGRLARFGTFVSSEEAVWRRREYEDEIFTAR